MPFGPIEGSDFLLETNRMTSFLRFPISTWHPINPTIFPPNLAQNATRVSHHRAVAVSRTKMPGSFTMFPCVLKWSGVSGQNKSQTWILRPFFWRGSLPKPFGVTIAEVSSSTRPHHLPDVYMDTKAFLVDGYGSEGTPVTIQNDCSVTMYGMHFLNKFQYFSPSLQYQIR